MFGRKSESTVSGTGQDKRHPVKGRRSYHSLRILAKVYDIAAPVVAVILIIVALIALIASNSPLPSRLFGFLMFILFAGIYYLFLKAAAQVISLLFDIANDVRALAQGSGSGEE